jgi:hypothetical protein
MIIDNTYFKGEIYIPHAKPGITDNVTEIENDILFFIDDYSRQCLVESLGYKLFKEFSAELDSNEANGLKPAADQKWDDLLNGKEYTDTNGVLRNWRGIRYENIKDGGYDRSFLANYVYYFYEKDQNSTRADVGDVKESAKNAMVVSRIPKVNRAWRQFVEQVQGKRVIPTIVTKDYGYSSMTGIDWYGADGQEVSMYRFIRDTNLETPDTYEDFLPKKWIQTNELGI